MNTIKRIRSSGGKNSWQALEMGFTYPKIKDGEDSSICPCRYQLEKQPKRTVRGLGEKLFL